MNVVREIQRINEQEIEKGISEEASWHAQYKHSAYIFIGGLPLDLTEGDVICVFSQYGEVVDINLVRDKITGKSKGFGFIAYENQRSTILAVDNLNGAKVLGKILRVDHVSNYRPPKPESDDEFPKPEIAPPWIPVKDDRLLSKEAKKEPELDEEDPMKDYFEKKEAELRESKRIPELLEERSRDDSSMSHDQRRHVDSRKRSRSPRSNERARRHHHHRHRSRSRDRRKDEYSHK